MATSISPPPPPSTSPFPPTPSKHGHAHKPNPHPYAIKTTSTGVLSRSNSSGHNAHTARYHYVPPSPTRSPTRSAGSDHFRGHRYSKSLNSELPSPLPVPPSPSPSPSPSFAPASPSRSPNQSYFTPTNDTQAPPPPHRIKRADTLPSALKLPTGTLEALELPSNPKSWTPAQLASYLTATTVNPPEGIDIDMATFVKESGIGGKSFLRLNEGDLEGLGVPPPSRASILGASRTLRQNALRGRIWGFDADNTNTADEFSDADAASKNSHPSPFSSELYASSTSSVDLTSSAADVVPRRGHGRGRVRGMVETYERSSSFSSASGSEVEAEVEMMGRDEKWSEEEGESAIVDDDSRERSPIPPPEDATAASEGGKSEGGAAAQNANQDGDGDGDGEEPTVEALLAQHTHTHNAGGRWGARAWEDMEDVPGVTVKRIPSASAGDGSGSGSGSGSGKGRIGSGSRGKAEEERRVVTAIFSPDRAVQDEAVDELAVPPEFKRGRQGPANDDDEEEDNPEPEPDSAGSVTFAALEAELESTRELLGVFRKRLEDVERKVESMEGWRERMDRDVLIGSEREADVARRAELEARERALQRAIDALGEQRENGREREDDDDDPGTASPFTGAFSLLTRASAYIYPSPSPPPHARPSSAGSASASGTDSPKETQAGGKYSLEPTSVSAIPSYVLLVSLGVCVVVLKVVMNKVAGRGLKRT